MNVLANDGISQAGVEKLNAAGFNTIVKSIDQEKIIGYINENNIEVLLVRSATKVRKDLIDSCKSLKIIGRGGVGMDNIDVSYATIHLYYYNTILLYCYTTIRVYCYTTILPYCHSTISL